MAGDPPQEFKGFFKYYNSTTDKGRAGAAMMTLGGLALLFVYLKFKPSKKQ